MERIQKTKKKNSVILNSILYLFIKITVSILIVYLLFTQIFGIYRCMDNSMSPAFNEGDIILFYRLQKEYRTGDSIIVKKNGETQLRRIIAVEKSSVDITKDGLKINGYLQQEKGIYYKTAPYKEGISFPITLKQNQYFVLGDSRLNVKDSRIYGAVNTEEIQGIVTGFFRRQKF